MLNDSNSKWLQLFDFSHLWLDVVGGGGGDVIRPEIQILVVRLSTNHIVLRHSNVFYSD
jgi:hypothetical protein